MFVNNWMNLNIFVIYSQWNSTEQWNKLTTATYNNMDKFDRYNATEEARPSKRAHSEWLRRVVTFGAGASMLGKYMKETFRVIIIQVNWLYKNASSCRLRIRILQWYILHCSQKMNIKNRTCDKIVSKIRYFIVYKAE